MQPKRKTAGTKKGRKKQLSLYKSRVNKGHVNVVKTVNTRKLAKTKKKESSDDSSDYYIEVVSDSDEDREIQLPSPKRTKTDSCVRTIAYAKAQKTRKESSKQHTEVCIEYLSNEDLWKSLVPKLNDSGNLVDFVTFIKCLQSGAIPMDNIVFLLMLERARFGARQNTCGMRYREVTKLFWSIVYRLCKSSGLKFFSGPKNWGQVVSKETSKGHYKGVNSKINFAVPNEKMLRSINNKLPKVIPPGIIEKSLHLLKDQKDVILMADGKLVSKGLGSNFLGDVNLFGHEK